MQMNSGRWTAEEAISFGAPFWISDHLKRRREVAAKNHFILFTCAWCSIPSSQRISKVSKSFGIQRFLPADKRIVIVRSDVRRVMF
jgi:hypothetical protein